METSAAYCSILLGNFGPVLKNNSIKVSKHKKVEYKQKKFPSWRCSIAKGGNKWPMAQIVSTEPDLCGIVRIVQLKVIDTSNNNIKLFQRPISKIVLLVENQHGSITNEGSYVGQMSSWNTTCGEVDVVVQCRSGVALIYGL